MASRPARPAVVRPACWSPALLLLATGHVVAGQLHSTVFAVLEVLPLLWRRRHAWPVFLAVAALSAAQAFVVDEPTTGQLAFPVAVYSVARWSPRWQGVAALLVGYAGALVAATRWLLGFGAGELTAANLDPLRRHHQRDRHRRVGAGLRGPVAGEVRRLAGRARRAGRADGRARGRARRPRRAVADRPRDARRGRPRAVGDRDPGRRRPLRRGQGPRRRGRHPRDDLDDRPRGAHRDAPAAGAAPRRRHRRGAAARPRRRTPPGGRGARRGHAGRGRPARRAGRRARRRRAGGVPHRAGGADQRAQARRSRRDRVRAGVGRAARSRSRCATTGAGRPPSSDGHGLGLVGMRERAAVHGGTLAAGPATGGGFAVSARLPL